MIIENYKYSINSIWNYPQLSSHLFISVTFSVLKSGLDSRMNDSMRHLLEEWPR